MFSFLSLINKEQSVCLFICLFVCLYICLFVCLGIYIPFENFSLIGRCHHYRSRASNNIHSLYFTRQMSLVYYRWLCKRFKIAAALVIAENKWTRQLYNPTHGIGSGLCLNSRTNWS